jgi:hypothetical protein
MNDFYKFDHCLEPRTMDAAEFSKQIAQALREAEDSPTRLDNDSQQLLHDTYQRLCFDDPVGISTAGCVALHHALVNLHSPYALSNRLVDGIHQCCHRYVQSTATAAASEIPSRATETLENDHTDDKADASAALFAVPEADIPTAGAYAQLAWTIHVTIPLECCRTADLNQAATYLGSFPAGHEDESSSLVVPTSADERDPTVHEGGPEIEIHDNHHNIAQAINGANLTNGHDVLATNGDHVNGHAASLTNGGHVNGNDDDSLAEVFAEESDASDYEFESEYRVQERLAELNAWALTMQQQWDPLQISQRPHHVTWDDVSRAVSTLLESLTHSQLSGLSLKQYQTLRCADYLTQLCVALLVPASSLHSPMLSNTSNHASWTADHWQRLGTHVLHVFRDCTLQHVTLECHVLEDFLRLIRILLQVDQTLPSLSPATWVGLSSLSAMCMDVRTSSDKSLRNRNTIRILQLFVVDASDDLSDLLERSSHKSTVDKLALQWSYLSLFQVLTATASTGPVSAMPNDRAQLLLNSGLFRQWLLYWSQTEDINCRMLMQWTILDLCLCSPSLLGKYAWRFPDLAVRVTSHVEPKPTMPDNSDESETQPLLQAFLWNLLGAHLAAAESGIAPPRVQWKNKPVTEDRTMTHESCRQSFWAIFRAMRANVARILTDWKLRREHNVPPVPLTVNDRTKSALNAEILHEFDRLAQRLSFPLLRSLFEQMVSVDATSTIRQELLPLAQILAHWPHADVSFKRKPDVEDAEPDADVAVSPPRPVASFPLEEEEAVRTLRKAIKTILSVLESPIHGASDQRQFSSKAD